MGLEKKCKKSKLLQYVLLKGAKPKLSISGVALREAEAGVFSPKIQIPKESVEQFCGLSDMTQ